MISIIPAPAKLEPRTDSFVIRRDTHIVATKEARPVADYLIAYLRAPTGFDLSVQEGEPHAGAISLELDPAAELGTEGYRLDVSNQGIAVRAESAAGLFYGVQTLLQLLPPSIFSAEPTQEQKLEVPGVTVEDHPRFGWRGTMLDVCRHFFDKEFVKRYIDLLALHKLNTFHLHLTDDQGWRIEIKKFPKLTEIGAWRNETMGDGTPHGGFFSQDEIREIVHYAADRYITVVPEIEMPGHAMAALAAYPDLSCTGGPFKVWTQWGIAEDVFCAGKESTFQFLEGVLDEVLELFPSEFIHVGGDECPKVRWQSCPKCQARIHAESLHDEHELQSYFIP